MAFWRRGSFWFMDGHRFATDLLTGLEPGTPGGETPPSTAGGTPAATEAGFMKRLIAASVAFLVLDWTPAKDGYR